MHGHEVAERFRHLLACRRVEKTVVQPIARERLALMCAYALRDLVLVVRKDEIEPAAMDIESFAEKRLGHRRAFDVPARSAASPRAFPARQIRCRRLPQHEVA